MESFKALIELSVIIFGVVLSFAVTGMIIFNGRCEQDKESDDAYFWERFNKNLEQHRNN